jgi:hypothetical protein
LNFRVNPKKPIKIGLKKEMGNKSVKPILKKYLKEKTEKNLENLIKTLDKDNNQKIDSQEINQFITSLENAKDVNEDNYPGITKLLKEMEYLSIKLQEKEITYEKMIETIFVKKIVLLGTGEVGKTTFFRQFSILLNLYDESNLKYEKDTIIYNVMNTFLRLYQHILEKKIKLENLENKVNFLIIIKNFRNSFKLIMKH